MSLNKLINFKYNIIYLIAAVIFLFLYNYEAAYSENKKEIVKTYALSLTDTIKYKEGFKHFDYANPNAPKGGTFRRGMPGTFDSFNPFAIKGNAFRAAGYMYDTLLVGSLDESNTYYGLIAETIEHPTDFSYVIFNLRKNAYFHDGKNITADDVVFSFNSIKNVSPFYKKYYDLIERAEKLGKYRVKFYFKGEKFSKELPLIVGQLTIIPKHYWEKRDFTKSTLEVPLGSGPYKIKEFVAGKTVTFERVKDYWAQDLGVTKGLDNFDILIYEYFRDSTVAFEAFKAGQYDFLAEGNDTRWHRGYTGKYFDKKLIIKQEVHDNSPQGLDGIFMNMNKYPFNNILVRKAFVYAFDYEWINKNINFGEYKRYNSFFSNSELAGNNAPNEDVKKIIKEVMPEASADILEEPFLFPVSKENGNRSNLKIALKLLQEAGFTLKKGKLLDKSGKQLIVDIPVHTKAIEGELMYYKNLLSKIGIELNMLYLDTSQYIERVNNKNYQLLYAGHMQSESPGNEQRGMWSSEAATQIAGSNYSYLQNKSVDILVEKIATATSRQDIINYTQALDKILLSEWMVIPLGYLDKFRIAYWDKFGMPKIAPKYNISLSSWWVIPEKEERVNKNIIK